MSIQDSNENKAKINKIKEELGALTLLEAADLVSQLKEEWGVSDAPVAVAAQNTSSAGGDAEAPKEKTSFDVKLSSAGDKKISVIKEVKSLLGLGLKEAKELVDSASKSPQSLKQGVKKDEADSIKATFEGLGAQVLVE